MAEVQKTGAPESVEAPRTPARFGFVILHYLAYDMTCECVDNLLTRFGAYDIHIVIVDNASPNGTGKQLVDRYAGNDRVTVLLADDNLGFARGNNLGYDWLLAHYDPDFAIVMNNDVLIEQDEFLRLIPHVYNQSHFAVLGPDIWSTRAKKHQNPYEAAPISDELLLRRLNVLKKRVAWSTPMALFQYVRERTWGKLVPWIIASLKKCVAGQPQSPTPLYSEEHTDAVLHGACYIFSRQFIDTRQYCFCPDTFLYVEEDILYDDCMRLGLKMLYSPELRVEHLEDVATDALSGNDFLKLRHKDAELLKSVSILARCRGLIA